MAVENQEGKKGYIINTSVEDVFNRLWKQDIDSTVKEVSN